jgi:hypothetical protein
MFALCLFTGLMSLVLLGFGLYQAYQVAINTTTVEGFKWDDLRKELRRRADLKPGSPPPPPSALDGLTQADLINIYNHGIVENFKEVLSYDTWIPPKQDHPTRPARGTGTMTAATATAQATGTATTAAATGKGRKKKKE